MKLLVALALAWNSWNSWSPSNSGALPDARLLDLLYQTGGYLPGFREVRGPFSPWMVHWRGDEIEVPEKPRWLKHQVAPRERLTQIAARYGVKAADIRRWNELESSKLKKGDRLRVLARRIPPPWREIGYTVRDGDSWGRVAAAHRVDSRDLRAWNWPLRSLTEGQTIKVWIDPGAAWTVGRRHGPVPASDFVIPDGAVSVGRPNRGKITDAVELPDSPLYRKREGVDWFWGSSHTLRNLYVAFANFRHDTGFEGEVMIGSISRRRGGRFPPHVSHRSGRDVDIRLPLLPGVPATHRPNADEVDWYATWGLVRALIDTGEVQLVFLENRLQRRLYNAARAMGERHEELAPLIDWPYESGHGRGIVRHSKGHDAHIHVRFSCAATEERCRSRSR